MRIELDKWDMLPTQREVYCDDVTTTIMQSAGLGSGKTHNLCRKLLKLSAINKNLPGAVLCPTFKDFRRDVKPEMYDILENHLGLVEKKHFWFHKSYSEFSFIWNKKPLYVLSAEQPIAGPNLAYCGVNEFSLIQFERIKEMLRRVRVKEAKLPQKLLVGTPEDVYGWLEEFVELQEEENKKNPNSFKIYYADTKENIHISNEYRAHLESMLDEQALKVFASGQIIRIGGTYFYYAFDRQRNIKELNVDHLHDGYVYVGLDFNVGNMSATFSRMFKDENNNKCLHIFDEVVLKNDSDTRAIARYIKNRYPVEDIIITCDSSGKARKTSGRSDVEILKQEGFESHQIRFKASNPRMRQRQLLHNGLISKGHITVSPKCKLTIRDYEKVQQNKVDYTKIKDKDDRLTHLSDGLDYLVDWEYKLNPRHSKNIQL
jgi:hypothetical protein